MDKDLAGQVTGIAWQVVASGAISANGHGNVSVRMPGAEERYFPGRDAIIRLVGAGLAEQNDEWTESRRYMGLDILAACRKGYSPAL